MLTEVLLLNPVYVTFFWAVVLILQSGKGNEPKRFLAILMSAAFILYLSHLFYFTQKHAVYIWLDSFYNLTSQSVYPLFYVYVLLLTQDKTFTFRKHGKYLIIPVIVFILTSVGYIIMDNTTEKLYVSRVMYGLDAGGRGIGYMRVISLLSRITFVMQVMIYLHLSFRKIRKHNHSIDNYFSAPELRSLSWVQIFNIVLFIASFASITIAALGRERFDGSPLYLLLPSLVFSVALFTIGLLGQMQQSVHVTEAEPVALFSSDDRIPEKLAEELVNMVEREHLYLNKDLNIWDITARLATNRTYVSRIINNEFGLNFCGFINRYRVDHAKKLLASSRHYSVEEIADMSGFGSVNSLYRAFSASEKISLAQYRTNLKMHNLL